MRGLASLAIAVVFATAGALAQTNPNTPRFPATSPHRPSRPKSRTKAWSFFRLALTYIEPDSRNTGNPLHRGSRLAPPRSTLQLRGARHRLGVGWLQLQRRRESGVECAPDARTGVSGKVTGVAPGYTGSLSWWKLGLYSEGEHVFDTGDSSNSFTYTWSELTLAPVEWFRFGLATQRTYVHQSDGESQGGPFVAQLQEGGLEHVFFRSGR